MPRLTAADAPGRYNRTITGKKGGNGSETLPLPLFYTSDNQLNALVPYGVDLNANQ